MPEMPEITMELIQKLASESPLLQKAIAESDRDRERALDAQRAAALATITDVQARDQRERLKIQARVTEARQAVVDAQQALRAAQTKYGEAFSADVTLSNATALAMTKAEAVLIDTAPDSVNVFRRWLFDEFDRVRHSVTTHPAPSTGNPALGAIKRKFVQTNAPTTKQYVAAIHAARQDIDAFVLTAPTRAAIDARIADLRSALPNNIETEVVESPR